MLLALCASPAAQQLPGPLHCIGVAKALTVLGMFIKYFSLYSVYIQGEGFALTLTSYLQCAPC